MSSILITFLHLLLHAYLFVQAGGVPPAFLPVINNPYDLAIVTNPLYSLLLQTEDLFILFLCYQKRARNTDIDILVDLENLAKLVVLPGSVFLNFIGIFKIMLDLYSMRIFRSYKGIKKPNPTRNKNKHPI